jgi:hypothetical protein
MHTVRFLLISILFLAACRSLKPSESTFHEAVGDQAKRVSTITSMISKAQTLPTSIQDAQLVEQRIGDGEFGPSDYRTFALIQIAPQDAPAWQAILTPLDKRPDYQSLPQPYSWWVDENSFAALQFYTSDALTGKSNGWIAMDAENGKIYLYTFTT